jgi:PilZ domain
MYCYVRENLSHSGRHVTNAQLETSQNNPPQDNSTIEKLIHLALPVRLVHMQGGERTGMELTCTYDVHPRGARLRSIRDVRVGDLITVERGRMKSLCRVVWAADPDSALQGQFTVECVTGSRTPWEDELRKMEEQYLPLISVKANKNGAGVLRTGEQNRRRRPRYAVNGGADVMEIGGGSRMGGLLEQISEFGCLIRARGTLAPDTGLRLTLNVCDVSVALRGSVRYTSESRAMGVEFQEIRQGDRPLLDYVLEKLRKPRRDDFADLEVITEISAAQ